MSLIKRAHELAVALDVTLQKHIAVIGFDSFNSFFIQLRAYLQNQNDRLGSNNDIYGILRRMEDDAIGLVELGPQIDKGSTVGHFHFPSGARLSFGITLRKGKPCTLVSYRFHYQCSENSTSPFVRFDLNPQQDAKPLLEPVCHVHPGLEGVRLPFPALTPNRGFGSGFLCS